MDVPNSIMLYGSEILAETLEKAGKLTCIGTENGCTSYRVGVSYSLVIAGIINMDLSVAERPVIYKAKSARNHLTAHFRENTITKWQR